MAEPPDKDGMQPISQLEALYVSEDAPGGSHAPPNSVPHKCGNSPRALVRLFQCARCSLPLKQPVALRCGKTVCRDCMPRAESAVDMTVCHSCRGPAEAAAENSSHETDRFFLCPFPECNNMHHSSDCGPDITLAKIMELVGQEMGRERPLAGDAQVRVDEVTVRMKLEQQPAAPEDEQLATHTEPTAEKTAPPESSAPEQPHSRVLGGGKLVAAYKMAELGELPYYSDVTYTAVPETDEAEAAVQQLDLEAVRRLKEIVLGEADCLVCWATLLDPVTMACGHTFCRECVGRILDHSPKCPLCRVRTHRGPSTLLTEARPNERLTALLVVLCPQTMVERLAEAEEARKERMHPDAWLRGELPLFVCAVAFPHMPMALHVFEPRYKLMMRRAMLTDRRFGMVAHSAPQEPGGPPFLRHGTLLHIVNFRLLQDGRSLVETVGVERFRVRSHRTIDGYTVGRVDRVADIDAADEARIEAADLARPLSEPGEWGLEPADVREELRPLTTEMLLGLCAAFVRRVRDSGSSWLSDSVVQTYGPMPEDPARFPFWLANVLPLSEESKSCLLPLRSVRARLLVSASWVRSIERQPWFPIVLHPSMHAEEDETEAPLAPAEQQPEPENGSEV